MILDEEIKKDARLRGQAAIQPFSIERLKGCCQTAFESIGKSGGEIWNRFVENLPFSGESKSDALNIRYSKLLRYSSLRRLKTSPYSFMVLSTAASMTRLSAPAR